MKLPLSFSLKKKELPKYYLALLLREEKVTAVIFEELQGKAHVIGKHEEEFDESIETASSEEFLDRLDKAISIAEGKLPKDIETQKTIFGLKETWVENAKIKKEYLSKLKKACDELGLTPIGFLVIHEAISHYLQEEEGAPVSAVFVESGRNFQVVSLLRAGRLVETHRAKLEDSPVKTTDRLLHHFSNPQILPTRIILLDEQEDDKVQQDYISHSWSKSLPFLHVPQITVLQKGFDAKAMLYGAASQMGFDVLGSEKELSKGKDLDEEAEEDNEEEEKDTDKDQVELDEPENPHFGFVIGKDIASKQKKDHVKEIKKERKIELENEGVSEKENESFLSKNSKKIAVIFAASSIVVPFLKKAIGQINKVKRPPLPTSLTAFAKGPKIILAIPTAAILLIAILLFYFFGVSADVTLFAKSQDLSKKEDITLSKNSPTDPSQDILGVSLDEITEDGSSTAPATGTKQVGDNAKGTVTIYNNTDQTQNLAKGTVIISDKGLKFDLDQSISVASASGDAFSGTKPGTSQVNIVADDIGPEYNLPSGSKFTVSGGPSEIAAKNDNAFSGGTKRTVTVISKDDIQKAQDSLIKSLEQKAKNDIAKKSPKDVSLLDQFISEDIKDKDVSKKAGDEGSSVTYKGTVSYQTAIFKTKDAQSLSVHILSVDLSKLSANSISYSFENVKANADSISATIVAKASLLPKIDEKELSRKISGKSQTEAKNILTSIPQIEDIFVTFHPNLPFLPKNLPGVSSHIHFKIAKQ